jgi:hypothetical protein
VLHGCVVGTLSSSSWCRLIPKRLTTRATILYTLVYSAYVYALLLLRLIATAVAVLVHCVQLVVQTEQ